VARPITLGAPGFCKHSANAEACFGLRAPDRRPIIAFWLSHDRRKRFAVQGVVLRHGGAVPKSKSKRTMLLTAAVLLGGLAIIAVIAIRPASSRQIAAASAPATGSGAAPSRSSSDMCLVKPCSTQACDACSNQNCAPPLDGCAFIDDAGDRKLCEDLYVCFTDPKQPCTSQGDAVRCWCGTNPTTCLTAATGPLAGNGPCVDKVFAGARSTDPETIRRRFLDPVFPLGRAVRLAACRGAFCGAACGVP
jgi:hypothetical protein